MHTTKNVHAWNSGIVGLEKYRLKLISDHRST